MLSSRLKEERKNKNLSQLEISKIIGVSQQTIGSWEIGRTAPDIETIKKLADFFNVSTDYLLGKTTSKKEKKKGVKIPVLGRVQAGVPVEAVEEIIDYEEIDEEMAKTGDFFGLQIKGDSMETTFFEKDIVIVRKQPDLESGQIGVIFVNGTDATVKKVIKHDAGLSLVATNPAYPPRIFTFDDIAELPVTILGRVVELRRKF